MTPYWSVYNTNLRTALRELAYSQQSNYVEPENKK